MSRTTIQCTNAACEALFEVDEALVGKSGRCQRCQASFVIARREQDEEAGIWTPGDVLLGDFEVERILGRGGMGTVYRVRSRSNGQRFAVKTILEEKLGDEVNRRYFLDELRTWIDLPEHPHLTACRFFRTVGDQIAIFAEYVPGGSLADAIRGGRLTRLDQMLDVAIQFAWGLHAAHQCGVVHQDVKPGNVLLTDDGLVKVADFGLARARGQSYELPDDGVARSVLVSWRGKTTAYASPEQSRGQPLSRRTDVYSCGVSILELFLGEVTWRAGAALAKPDSLETYLASGPAAARLPPMPPALADVLRKCLQREPAERWSNLAEVAEALREIYRPALGADYPRREPAILDRADQPADSHDRRTTTGLHWTDPQVWLSRAFGAEGRELKTIGARLPRRTGSRKAQAIADLSAYDQARRIFERLVSEGRKDLEAELASFCMENALVHGAVDDRQGEVALYDRAIALYGRLIEHEGRRELADELAGALMNKANAVDELGEGRAAVALYDRAIALLERLVEHEGRRELRGDLAWIIALRAKALFDLGQRARARAEVSESLVVLREEADRTGRAVLKRVVNWIQQTFPEIG